MPLGACLLPAEEIEAVRFYRYNERKEEEPREIDMTAQCTPT